jgi:hypothetical protein
MTAENRAAPSSELLAASDLTRLYPEMSAILDGRAGTGWADADLAAARAGFAADRFLALPGLLSAADVAVVDRYYRRLIEAGLLTLTIPPYPLRLVIADDPVGRALLRQFHPIIQAIAGRPIRQGYSFAAEYQPGAVLPMHTDRVGCEYSISLLVNYDPPFEGGRSPWPLDVASPRQAQPVRIHQALGDGILFKGTELPHGRPDLPQTHRCLILMVHYVDDDFPEERQDRC